MGELSRCGGVDSEGCEERSEGGMIPGMCDSEAVGGKAQYGVVQRQRGHIGSKDQQERDEVQTAVYVKRWTDSLMEKLCVQEKAK